MKIPKFIQSLSIVTIGVLLGKFTGFFKHLFIVKIFGVSLESDSFFIINNISELSVNILLSGIITGAFIPLAGELFVNNRDKFKTFVSSAFFVFGTTFFCISVLFYIFAIPLSKLLASGFSADQTILIAQLIRILSPGLFFISLAAISRGILHINDKFAVPSFGLLISNLTVIFTTWFFHEKLGIYAPAIGTSLGFFFWFLVQWPGTFQLMSIQLKLTSNLSKLLKFSIPSVGILFFSNIIFILEKTFASNFHPGTITELNMAFRTSNVFSSLLVIPLGTVLLPKLSKKYNRKNLSEFIQIVKNSVELISYIILTFLIFLVINSQWIIQILWSNETSINTINVSQYLIIYTIAISCLFYYIILNRIFFAMQKLQYLVISNFLGFIVYLLIIFLLKDIFQVIVFPYAFLGYAITVILYLGLIFNFKLFKTKRIDLDFKNIIINFSYTMLVILLYLAIKKFMFFFWINFLYSFIAIVIFFIFQKSKIIRLFRIDGETT